jgi:hypothetical protein
MDGAFVNPLGAAGANNEDNQPPFFRNDDDGAFGNENTLGDGEKNDANQGDDEPDSKRRRVDADLCSPAGPRGASESVSGEKNNMMDFGKKKPNLVFMPPNGADDQNEGDNKEHEDRIFDFGDQIDEEDCFPNALEVDPDSLLPSRAPPLGKGPATTADSKTHAIESITHEPLLMQKHHQSAAIGNSSSSAPCANLSLAPLNPALEQHREVKSVYAGSRVDPLANPAVAELENDDDMGFGKNINESLFMEKHQFIVSANASSSSASGAAPS